MSATVVPVLGYGRGANKVSVSGTAPVVGNTVDGMNMPNDGRTVVDVRNTNGVSTDHIVGFVPVQTIEGESVAVEETVTHGTTDGFGPFPVSIYGTTLHMTANHAELTFIGRRVPLS